MNLRLSPLWCAVLSALCVAQSPASEPPKTLHISGRVVQDPGAQPLRKVDLRIIGGKDSGANAITATTDAEGKFQIEALPPGRYHVTEFLKAYEERGLKVQVEEGSRKNVSVKLVSDNVAQ